MLLTVIDATQKGLDGAALIALRFVIGDEFEIHGRKKVLGLSR
jgi:hypothetical protein